jgi:hypothetical protein
MKALVIFTVLMLFLSLGAASQTYLLNPSTHNTTINTCSGTLYDSGGASGYYSNNEDYTITICSDNGGNIILNFTTFSTESVSWDHLTVYNANDNSTIVARSGGTSLQGQTIETNTNCVRLVWHTDGSVNSYSGFAIGISCRFPCQAINMESVMTNPPYYEDGGIRYIDICPGDEITFSATGTYPENNLNYTQSDATSTFKWFMTHDNFITGNPAAYTFDESRGYEITFNITDV